MAVRFTPPYPIPHKSKSGFLTRFVRGWHSWLHVLFEKSYTMKLGEVHIPALSFYVANELPLVRPRPRRGSGRLPQARFPARVGSTP